MWYDGEKNRVYWLDIWGCKVFIHDLATAETRVINVTDPVTTIVPREGEDGFVIATCTGFYLVDEDFTKFDKLPMPDDIDFAKYRGNDGKVAPDGWFWVGAMELNSTPGLAKEYVVTKDKCWKVLDGLDIPNGIVWNKAHDTMYFNDTLSRRIYAFDYTPGHIENQRVVYVHGGEGVPDGMAIDEDDNLWIAIYGDAVVLKVDPRKGELLDTVAVDCPGCSSVAVGGGKLWITTGTEGLDDEGKKKYPHAGGVFIADIPQQGVPSFRFKG